MSLAPTARSLFQKKAPGLILRGLFEAFLSFSGPQLKTATLAREKLRFLIVGPQGLRHRRVLTSKVLKMIAPPKGEAIANFENGLLGFGRVLEDGNSMGGWEVWQNDSSF